MYLFEFGFSLDICTRFSPSDSADQSYELLVYIILYLLIYSVNFIEFLREMHFKNWSIILTSH